MIETIALSSITKDSALQMRVAVNEAAVTDYAEVIRNTPIGEAVPLPPIVVFRDGKKLYLADGFHRHEGHIRAGATEIQADVREGTKREAILFSVGANAAHGLRRTNEDKRKAVLVLLADHEWSKWSDREIGRTAHVHHETVARIRRDLTGEIASEDRTYTTRHGTEAVMKTENIGKADKPSDRDAKREGVDAAEAQRAANIAQLSPDVRDRMAAADEAKTARASETVGLSPEDRIAELEAEVESLKAELAAKDARIAELARLEAMEADWKAGGFEAVIASKDERFTVMEASYHRENREKVTAQRELKRLRQGNQQTSDVAVDTDMEVRRANAG